MSGIDARARMQRRGRLLKASELVAQEIVLDIVERGLTPGERLPQEVEMAETYGVARSTVREALRILEVGGLVQMRTGPKGGPSVRDSDPADLGRMASLYLQAQRVTLGEVLAARRMLELVFLREAMVIADPAFLDRVRDLHERGARLDLADDAEYLAVTGEFHELMSAGSSNRVLTSIAQALMAMFVGEIGRDVFPDTERALLLDQHQQVLAAILAGDADGAEAAMRHHIEHMQGGIAERQPRAVASVIRWH